MELFIPIYKRSVEERREYNRIRRRKYYHTSRGKDVILRSVKKYSIKNREKILLWHKIRIEKDKKEIFKKLGNKCIRCGFSDDRALQVDHINGGGHREVQLVKGHTNLFHEINKMNEYNLRQKYQLLCANCNWIKRVENNEA